MYTVKQVASLTGVAEGTLRVWERRYGVVRPERSAGGYRLYDDAEIARLREMATLVESGMPASSAARRLGDAPGPADAPSAGGSRGATSPQLPEPGALVAAARSLEPGRLAAVVGGALGAGPFEAVATGWIVPQLEILGRAWADGELTVAQEHFASAGLMRNIATVYEQAVPDAAAPEVLVGLPAGDRHELALFCFATCLRRRGLNVVYLGPDVPAEEWERAAARGRARSAVIGVTAAGHAAESQRAVDLLQAIIPRVGCYVGGSCRATIQGATALPDDVAEAAAVVHTALVAGRC